MTTSQHKSVAIVIPCYNEANRLPVDVFRAYSNTRSTHLIFVNDGSTDETQPMLDGLVETMNGCASVLHLSDNQGKAEAVRQGLLQATSLSIDYAGFWDADLSTSLDEIERFCEVLDSKPTVDVVLGSRISLLGREVRRERVRHYFGRAFATAASMALALPVYDTQCGAKLFRVGEALGHALEQPFSSRWIFDVELLARYIDYYQQHDQRIDDKVCELPLMAWNDVAGSKVQWSDGLRAGGELAEIYFKYRDALRANRRRR